MSSRTGIVGVNTLLSSIFSDLCLASSGTGRAVLYFVLFINLAIDSCGRIREIVPSSKALITHCLHWSDSEIWVKPAEENAVGRFPKIYALVEFQWLKGQRLSGKNFEKVCIHLLCSQFAFQDTIRLILLLGIIKGHSVDVKTWEDLRCLHSNPSGSRLRIKISS